METVIAGVVGTGLRLTGCATRGSHASVGDTDDSSPSASPPPTWYWTPYRTLPQQYQGP